MTWKRIIFILALLLVLGLIFIKNLGPKEAVKLPVTVEASRLEPITQVVTASGKVRPEKQVKVSADVGGYIRKLTVKQGDMVEAGQLLVEVNPEVYQARVMQAEAAQSTAKANLSLAEAGLVRAQGEAKRVQGLFAKDLTSAAAQEKAHADLLVAQSQVEAARGQLLQSDAMLSSARKDLSKCTILAPMTGTVIDLLKELGERVAGGEFREDIIMLVADLTRMEVEVEVGERDVVLIHLEDVADIEVDAHPGKKIPGKVTKIANAGVTRNQWTESEVTKFRVVVAVGASEYPVRPQMSATVGIRTDHKEKALTVPLQSVTIRRPSELKAFGAIGPTAAKEQKPLSLPAAASGESMKPREEPIEVVFVLQDGKAQALPVKTGLSSESRIEIVEGLSEGQQVISGPYRALSKELSDGTMVTRDQPKGAGKRPSAGQESKP